MDARRVVVVEANEVPLRVIADLATTGRIPFLASLLEAGALMETEVREDLSRELYPSQTWASMNTGVPFADHGVYWYGDPKPQQFPLYWQLAAAAGRSVGLVNTLHSSPVHEQCGDGEFRFVIPDCFSSDPATIPDRYRHFQRANLSLTGANSRRASLRYGRSDLVDLARSVPSIGLRPRSIAELVRLAGGVGLGRTPRERLRCGQFLMQRDLFLRLLDERSPDLAMLFTNHVAAAMHRYWYAMYPDDFGREHYGARWVERYRNEIPNAIILLDRFLERLHRWCVVNHRTLVLVSSMGQGPSGRLESGVDKEAVVVDPEQFLAAMGVDGDVTIMGSMAPQLTIGCEDPTAAAETASKLANADAGEVFWDVDGLDAVVTLTYRIEVVDGATVRIGGVNRPASSTGVRVHEVDDHSSGRHTSRGILGVANSPSSSASFGAVVDYLDVAPAMLSHLGVATAAHHRTPELRI